MWRNEREAPDEAVRYARYDWAAHDRIDRAWSVRRLRDLLFGRYQQLAWDIYQRFGVWI